MSRKQRIVAASLVIAKNLIMAYGAGYVFGKTYKLEKSTARTVKILGAFAVSANAAVDNYLAGREIGKVLEEEAEEKETVE